MASPLGGGAGCHEIGHPHLLALSDLHVQFEENADFVRGIRPEHPDDWLLIPGDCGEYIDVVTDVLAELAGRFKRVVWAPGNHELWNHPRDPLQLRGNERYDELVKRCRSLGVVTPEDSYPLWECESGHVQVVPTFLLYDYSFHPPGMTSEEAYARAQAAHHMLTDEFILDPYPYATREEWCRERVALTEGRLRALPPGRPIVIVNHYPLHRHPTSRLFSQHIALWCGSSRTEQWHREFAIDTVVYGHLHIPMSEMIEGVRYEEVSLGYPREWRRHPRQPRLRRVRCGRT